MYLGIPCTQCRGLTILGWFRLLGHGWGGWSEAADHVTSVLSSFYHPLSYVAYVVTDEFP